MVDTVAHHHELAAGVQGPVVVPVDGHAAQVDPHAPGPVGLHGRVGAAPDEGGQSWALSVF